MYLIKNKRTNQIVHIQHNAIDLFAFYHINLKINYPNLFIDDFEVIEENDEQIVQQILQSKEVYLTNEGYKFIADDSEPVYPIDKISQLQCQILMMQKRIDNLTNIVNEMKT